MDALKEYKTEHGDCIVPRTHQQLGRAVHNLRSKRSKGKLSEYQIKELDALGFKWSLYVRKGWDKNYQELCDYKQRTGHVSVSHYENPPLYKWLRKQHLLHKNKKLEPDRQELLERVGVQWQPKQCQRKNWLTSLAVLRQYKKEHGHINVSQKENPGLYKWVRKQHQAYRNQTLESHKVEKLEKLGFEWNASRDRTLSAYVSRKRKFEDGADDSAPTSDSEEDDADDQAPPVQQPAPMSITPKPLSHSTHHEQLPVINQRPNTVTFAPQIIPHPTNLSVNIPLNTVASQSLSDISLNAPGSPVTPLIPHRDSLISKAAKIEPPYSIPRSTGLMFS